MIWLPYGEKNYDNNVELFSSNTGTLRTDGRTDEQNLRTEIKEIRNTFCRTRSLSSATFSFGISAT